MIPPRRGLPLQVLALTLLGLALLMLPLLAAAAGAAAPAPLPALVDQAPLLLLVALMLLLLGLWQELESGEVNTSEIALIGLLGGVVGASRLPFVGIPSVQPMTALVVLIGFGLGPRIGAWVGLLGTLVSSLFLPVGLWVPLQAIGWAGVGASAGLLGRVRPSAGLWVLMVLGVVWGFLFGWLTDLVTVLLLITQGQDLASALRVALLASVWFDVAHAVSNLLFLQLLGPTLLPRLRRHHARLQVQLVAPTAQGVPA